ncbi:MAG TPA: oligosaccharide flippase family protein [Candidatus Binataceae bacterium]|nr:oligosaccharide flippase family protein [Candidatus Binataceae bacterium]
MKRGSGHAPAAAPGGADDRRLWRAFARSVLFNLQAELVANLIRVGGVIFLARALEPRDFGLLRILIVTSSIAALLATGGFPEAVIQRKELLGEHQTTAWWVTAVCAAAAAAILFVFAPLLERLMAMVNLGVMIRLVCVPIFIEGTSAVPNALLQRALRYDALAAADIIAEGGFVAAAVALLYSGYPRLSLPCGLAARATLRGVTIWIASGFVPRGAPRLRAAGDLWPFAAGVLGGQTLVILSQNADYVMVGRLLGSRALGYYSMAWDLLRFVPERLYRVVGRVTVPAFSAIQEQRALLAHHYRALISMVSRLVLPAMALLAIAAPKLIAAIYGAKWMPAALPLRLLTVGLALIGLRLAIGSIYYARGLPALDILLHGLRLVAIVSAVTLLAPLGLAAVCAGMSAVESLVSLAGQWMVCRLIELSPLSLLVAALPGMRTAAVCALAALAGTMLGSWLASGQWLALALTLAPPAAVYCWQERSTARSLLRGGDLISGAAQAFGG